MSFWSKKSKETSESILGETSESSQRSFHSEERTKDMPPSSGPSPTKPPPTQNIYVHSNSTADELKNMYQEENAGNSSTNSDGNHNNTTIPKFEIFTPKVEIFTPKDETNAEKKDEKDEVVENLNAEVPEEENEISTQEEEDTFKPQTESEVTQIPNDNNPSIIQQEPTSGYEDNENSNENSEDNEWDWEMNEVEEESVSENSTQSENSKKHLEERANEINTSIFNSISEKSQNELSSLLSSLPPEISNTRFEFLEQKTLPAIPQIYETLNSRRQKFQSRLFEIDCKLASIQAKLAEESMDRHTETKDIFPKACKDLQRISDRFMSGGLMFHEKRSQILSMQKRLNDICNKALHYKHHTLNQIQHEEFDSIQAYLIENVQPVMKIHASKSEKRELALFRKFESLAGTCSRRYFEESSTRVADIQVLNQTILEDELEEKKIDYLKQIRDLRTQLNEEREARRLRDKQIVKDVHAKSSALQRALLEAVDGQEEGRN